MYEQMNQAVKFCPNCGAQIFNPQQGYCLGCGAQLSGAQFGGAPRTVKNYNLITAFISFFKRYADFKGRSRRQEFWFVYLANVIITTVLYMIPMMVIGVASASGEYAAYGIAGIISGIFWFLMGIYGLATIIPNFALQTRRLHDTGHSGKLLLLWLIPGVLQAVSIIIPIASAASMSSRDYAMYYNLYGEGGRMTYLMDNLVSNSGALFIVMLAGLIISAIVSLVLTIMFFVFYCQDGQRGENKYGMSPKYLN